MQIKKLLETIKFRSGDFDSWWDRNEITDDLLKRSNVSDHLATYCGWRFDVWYDRYLFNHKSKYYTLAQFCSHKFDSWWNPRLYKDHIEYVINNHNVAQIHHMKDFYTLSYYDKFEIIFNPFILSTFSVYYNLYAFFADKKTFWLDKNKILWDNRWVINNLLNYCSEDIPIWFDKNKFPYNSMTCERFASGFEHDDMRKAFIKHFRIWWDEDKFNFDDILKEPRTLNSWNNLYSEYRPLWEKKLMFEKLKRR